MANESATATEHKLIDTAGLLDFGEGTIVPILGAIGSLNSGIAAIWAAIQEIIDGGGTPEEIKRRLDACEQNILALALAFAIETGAEASGTSDNIVVEVFDSTQGYVIMTGVYDSTNHRLYA